MQSGLLLDEDKTKNVEISCQLPVQLDASVRMDVGGSRRTATNLHVMKLMLQSPQLKISRKASSSYSLRLDSGRQKDQRSASTKRRTNSTPASPSHAREPQCTCMTPEQYARLRAQDPRLRGCHFYLNYHWTEHLIGGCAVRLNHAPLPLFTLIALLTFTAFTGAL